MIAISLWLGWGGVEVGNASHRGRNNTWLCAERVKVRLLVLAVVCCFVALSGQSYLPTAFKWILWRSPGIMIIIIWPLLITLLWPGRDKKDDYKSWRWASGGILFEREREIPGTDQGAVGLFLWRWSIPRDVMGIFVVWYHIIRPSCLCPEGEELLSFDWWELDQIGILKT